MDDRGEKIITLAREMLRTTPHIMFEEETPSTPTRISMSFKVLCLATVLTAVGSSAVTEWATESRRPINHYERIELDALIFYITRLKGLDEQLLRKDIQEKLEVDDFNDINEQEFQIVRRYLQERAE